MSIRLSVVIPAYNEIQRLPDFLRSARRYLDATFKDEYEVIVVDDGSIDGTRCWLRSVVPEWPQLIVRGHQHNRGKGAAIRSGIEVACGKAVLFADADGAAPIEQEALLRTAIDSGADVAIGSRLIERGIHSCEHRWKRRLVGLVFARLARALLPIDVLDPQCGFKMLRSEVAMGVVECTKEAGYLLDLEILLLAGRARLAIAEIPIVCADRPGGKPRVVRDGLAMVTGLVRLRRNLANQSVSPSLGPFSDARPRGAPNSQRSDRVGSTCVTSQSGNSTI